MTKRQFLVILYLLVGIIPLTAQTFTEQKKSYPVSADGNKYVVSGFTPFSDMQDENIYANALLWIVKNVCPQLREGIAEVNVPAKNFSCDLILASQADSSQKNTYYCKALFQVKDGKLVYYLSNIRIESSAVIMKKITPMEKLQPDKKASHKEIMDDFVQVESQVLNKMFDFIITNQLSPITHWNEININKPVKGMTEDECLLAFGKPQTIQESNGEVQWMYSSSFYLFFKNGHVETIIKQLKQFIMKTIWKASVCIVAVLLSFSIYSCGDDDDETVGSRDLLLGTWNGVYYLSQEWEDGEKVSDSKEDFVNGTNRYSIEFKEDGTYVEKDVYNSSGSTNYYHGTWSYSGNKLTLIDTEEDNYTEVWTVTTMTENELVYELREKEKEDGTTYEYYEQHAFTR